MGPMFFRRMPPPAITEQEEVPPVDSNFTVPTPNEEAMIPTPRFDDYKQHLGQMPNREEYKPSLGRKLISVLSASLAGYGQNSATAGYTLGTDILNAPYRDAMDKYTKKSKMLGDVADLEQKENQNTRIWAESRENRLARTADAEARRTAANNRPARQLKPEIEYDEKGYATGRVWDPDAMEMQTKPELRGFRRSAESPAITQKKAANAVAALKATELKAVYDRLQAKYKDTPIIGNPHIGKGQGWLSETATDLGIINDPDVRNLHELSRELANERLYSLSGAQINNKEFERLRRTLADPNKSETAFPIDLARFMRYLEAADQGLISINRIDPVTGVAESDWTPELASNNVPDSTSSDVSNPTKPKRKYELRIE